MQNFSTRALQSHPRKNDVEQILSACLNAVEPSAAVRRFVQREGDFLLADNQRYNLKEFDQIVALAFGKAAFAMTRAVADLLAPFPARGLTVSKQALDSAPSGFAYLLGGHPLPTQASLKAGAAALDFVSGLTERDLLICLISGGGSALMSAPRNGLRLADLQALTQSLLACGARVDEINALRRRLDRVKGGGLAQAANGARVLSLILSDVVNNPLEAVASGPTAPDPTSTADALAILEKYNLQKNISPALLRILQGAPETPKLNDRLFERAQNLLVGSNALAVQAGADAVRALGFHVRSLGSAWQGEARQVAKELCGHFQRDLPRPFCLIGGGETTVTLRGDGRGGRNQELALAAAIEMDGLPNVLFLSLASDGEDGSTDAAGAVVSGETLQRGRQLGLDARAFLDRNDSYSYFAALDDLIKIGATGTNVNDLFFLFGF
ncbi:MAG: DUF4147 domain-containing protein [Anaerolineales bacterium]|nr:DUF4147 domain-containing protein [Anaerolineales bacterium]